MTDIKQGQISSPLHAIISRKVKSLRAQRGISKRTLSFLTDISERYLSRLENCTSNPTVDILWRICLALDVSIQDLVADYPGVAIKHPGLSSILSRSSLEDQEGIYNFISKKRAEKRCYRGVALLGIRAAGKSTLGNLLSAKTGIPFIKLGTIIESTAGMALSEIFALGGQHSYRRLEIQALKHVVENNSVSIIEVGGSIVSESQTYDFLRSHYYTIWVRATAKQHMERVIEQGDYRPLNSTSEATEDLKRIIEEREPNYLLADSVLDTSDRTVESCFEEILEIVNEYI